MMDRGTEKDLDRVTHECTHTDYTQDVITWQPNLPITTVQTKYLNNLQVPL